MVLWGRAWGMLHGPLGSTQQRCSFSKGFGGCPLGMSKVRDQGPRQDPNLRLFPLPCCGCWRDPRMRDAAEPELELAHAWGMHPEACLSQGSRKHHLSNTSAGAALEPGAWDLWGCSCWSRQLPAVGHRLQHPTAAHCLFGHQTSMVKGDRGAWRTTLAKGAGPREWWEPWGDAGSGETLP